MSSSSGSSGNSNSSSDSSSSSPLSPASYQFWEEFYASKEGSKPYEWYVTLPDFRKSLIKSSVLSPKTKNVLQIGCGNSLLAEQLLKDPLFPQDSSITNIDVCENAIEQMNRRKEEEFIDRDKNRVHYIVMDALNTTFESESFDFIIDKGTVDALLSTLTLETGENANVKKLMKEVERVLQPQGFFVIISRNGNSTISPYLYNDFDEDGYELHWCLLDTNEHVIKKGRFTNVNYVYIIQKDAKE